MSELFEQAEQAVANLFRKRGIRLKGDVHIERDQENHVHIAASHEYFPSDYSEDARAVILLMKELAAEVGRLAKDIALDVSTRGEGVDDRDSRPASERSTLSAYFDTTLLAKDPLYDVYIVDDVIAEAAKNLGKGK
ncbi:hypothetical protein GC177_06885 [bacterium]|nr:hypothetical protein [bacterium]